MHVTAPTVLRTRDVDLARARVADFFCDHRLDPVGRAHAIDMRLRIDTVGSMGLVHLDYGEPVQIRPGPLATFYLVQIPLAGRAVVEHGATRVQSSPHLATVLSPTSPTSMTWQRGNPQLCVRLRRSTVDRELMRRLGREITTPLRFDVGMDLRRPDVASWVRMVRFLGDEALRGASSVGGADCSEYLARGVVNQLLDVQPHNYSAALAAAADGAATLGSRMVTLIDDHLADPLGPGWLAERLRVSVRALREACRSELESTPTAVVKERRLLAARARLLDAMHPGRTVTDVALGVGLTHLGRFAVDYRARFGESPSETATTAV
ncbi:hypothetical protein AXK59_11670 [Tsukamurella tyrosinosolvens]|nr:hypothetical protein AXK59_11670 [Tsukamurella tyrosinosolvens]KZL95956.1 hypothetical protein AXX05_22775 [Tsukamurella tyrosinosolvens]